MRKLTLFAAFFISLHCFAQENGASKWTDSIFKTLSRDEQIAQLMVVRLSEKTATGYVYYDSLVMELVKKYNVGGVCLFQG